MTEPTPPDPRPRLLMGCDLTMSATDVDALQAQIQRIIPDYWVAIVDGMTGSITLPPMAPAKAIPKPSPAPRSPRED